MSMEYDSGCRKLRSFLFAQVDPQPPPEDENPLIRKSQGYVYGICLWLSQAEKLPVGPGWPSATVRSWRITSPKSPCLELVLEFSSRFISQSVRPLTNMSVDSVLVIW